MAPTLRDLAYESSMRIIKFIIFFVLAVAVFLFSLAFITHNKTPVEVDFLIIQLPAASLSSWLIAFFIAGGLFGLVASSLVIAKEKQARMRVERRLQTTSKLITGETN